MIISIADITTNPEIREVIRRSDSIRNATLDKCYSIPGYTELTRTEKLAIYDRIKSEIERSLT